MAENDFLINFSLLESIRSNDKGDIYDHCLKFLCDILLKENKTEPLSISDIQEVFKKYLNFKIPVSAIKVILGRGKRGNRYFSFDNAHYIPQVQNIKNLVGNFGEVKEDCIRETNKFYDTYILYVKDKYDIIKKRDEAEHDFYEIVSKYQFELTRAIRSSSINDQISKKKNESFLIGEFLLYIDKNEPMIFKYFLSTLKGVILANFLASDSARNNSSNLKNLNLYLDTPILLSFFGFNGDSNRKLTNEMITYSKKMGVVVKVFSCSLDEFESVLKAMISDLRAKDYSKFRDDTLSLLRRNKWDHGYLESLLTLYKKRLSSSGIIEVRDISRNEKFNIDSEGLEQEFNKNSSENYKNPYHDVKCVENIIQLRKYEKRVTLQQESHIFVSNNEMVIETTHKFFKNEIDYESVPLIASEFWVTNICWALQPDLFPEWPRHLIEANCKYLVYGDDSFWKDFVGRLERYKQSGEISEEDYELVRRENITKRSLKELSVKEGKDYSDKDAFSLIGKVKREILKEKDTKIDELSSKVNKYQFKLRKVCIFCGNLLGNLIVIGLIIVIIYIEYILMTSKNINIGLLIVSLLIFASLLYWGWNVKDLGGKFKKQLSDKLYQFLNKVIFS